MYVVLLLALDGSMTAIESRRDRRRMNMGLITRLRVDAPASPRENVKVGQGRNKEMTSRVRVRFASLTLDTLWKCLNSHLSVALTEELLINSDASTMK